MTPARVAVVGSLNMDLVASAPELPMAGETVMGSRLLHVPGGKGANQAVAAARLGCDVTMIGRVGDDDFGHRLLGHLSDDGVDVSHVTATAATTTGVALIVVSEDGENQIVVVPGANALLMPADVAAAEESIAAADVLLLQFEVPMKTIEAAAAIGHRHGTTVVLNPAPAAAVGTDLLSHIDVLAPNETEAASLTGGTGQESVDALEAARRLAARGPRIVIVTLGARGAVICENSEARLEPPYVVDAVVDSTGAGDAFLGALAAALGEGRTTSAALDWAMAAGALAVARVGAQPSLPQRAEVEDTISRQERTPVATDS